jgi:hypothetical protein
LNRRLIRFVFGSLRAHAAKSNIRPGDPAGLLASPPHQHGYGRSDRLASDFLPECPILIFQLAIVARSHQQIHLGLTAELGG